MFHASRIPNIKIRIEYFCMLLCCSPFFCTIYRKYVPNLICFVFFIIFVSRNKIKPYAWIRKIFTFLFYQRFLVLVYLSLAQRKYTAVCVDSLVSRPNRYKNYYLIGIIGFFCISSLLFHRLS